MGRSQNAVDQALRVALIVIGVGVAGYLAMLVLLSFAMQEPYPFLNVANKSGRPLLIEQADVVSSPGWRSSRLVWGNSGIWPAAGKGACEQDRLVARDLTGTVVARRTGACRSDTWTITTEGLSEAPRYRGCPYRPATSRSGSASISPARRTRSSPGGARCPKPSSAPRQGARPWE